MINRDNKAVSGASAEAAAPGSGIGGTEAFAGHLRSGVLAVGPPERQHLSVTLYRLLGRGRAVTRDELARACGLSLERTADLLGDVAPSALESDARGAIVGFSGLSLRPTRHRFVTSEVELHTWCAFDALFLPEILGKPAVLMTTCPASGAQLTVGLIPGELTSPYPRDAVMSIVTPDAKACRDNIRNAFCDHVSLFRDRATFAAWAQGRDGITCVTLEEAQTSARQRNARRYPDVKFGIWASSDQPPWA